MLNKNSAKEKVYSNIAFVNTLLNSTNNTTSRALSFSNIASNLSQFPSNQVKIYSLSGQLVLEVNGITTDLFTFLNSHLDSGSYIVKISIGQKEFSVNGKVFVK